MPKEFEFRQHFYYHQDGKPVVVEFLNFIDDDWVTVEFLETHTEKEIRKDDLVPIPLTDCDFKLLGFTEQDGYHQRDHIIIK